VLELNPFKERTSFLFIDGNNPPKNGSEKAKSEGARGPERKGLPWSQRPEKERRTSPSILFSPQIFRSVSASFNGDGITQ
jgi:hypothetical protein